MNEKLQRYRKSEKIPDDPVHDNIWNVVGDSWDELVRDNDLDVLVLFYKKQDVASLRFLPTYIQLAEKYQKNDKIRIARINFPANKLMGITQPTKFPSLTLFYGRKTHSLKKKESRYTAKDMSLKAIDEWLNKKSTALKNSKKDKLEKALN